MHAPAGMPYAAKHLTLVITQIVNMVSITRPSLVTYIYLQVILTQGDRCMMKSDLIVIPLVNGHQRAAVHSVQEVGRALVLHLNGLILHSFMLYTHLTTQVQT